MADIQKGISFGTTAPSNSVTAARLNSLVDAALLLPGAISDRSEKSIMAGGDFFLILDSVSGLLKKARYTAVNPDRGIIGTTRNLRASININALNLIALSCDEALLKDSGGNSLFISGLNVTVNTGSVGANGVDTAGTMTINTWYELWLISTGALHAGLLVRTGTSPAMPSGFTYKALVGAVRHVSSGNLIASYQTDRKVWLPEQVIFNDQVSVGPTGSYANVSAGVAPFAIAVSGSIGLSKVTVANTDRYVSVAAAANGIGAQNMLLPPTTAAVSLNSFFSAAPFRVPLFPPLIYWAAQTATSSSPVFRMTVSGFEI